MPDSPLPLFAPSLDPGPSFLDLLRRVQPDALPGAGLPGSAGFSGSSALAADVPHGTTVVAIRCAHGVVMAGDRRATAGFSIAGRRVEKVQPADDYSGVAIAGSAGPAIEMIRLFQTQLEHYEKVQGDHLSLEGKANQLAQMVRANLPAAMQGFVVVPIFAGFDRRRDQGRVFTYDATGGRYEELDFATNGSGSVHARNWIKAGWSEALEIDGAVSLAIRSLFAAADEDVATGGPDLVRRIYPTVAIIDTDGYRALDDDDVESRSQALLAGPERGGPENGTNGGATT
jgi:proteasome beta subunit